MKLTVKMVLVDENSKLPEKDGNFYDLRTREEIISLKGLGQVFIPLGVKMTLPKWYGAILKPRSSSFGRYGFIQTNSPGEIESDYSKEWMLPVTFLNRGIVPSGAAICQFQIYLLPEAPWYIKLKHLFVTGFKFEEYAFLTTNRGGFGHTKV